MGRKRHHEDDFRYWEAEIIRWELTYQFSVRRRETHESRDRFSEVLLLSIRATLAYPDEWRGIPIEASIYGNRDLDWRAANDALPETKRQKDLADPPEDVGYVSPVLKTKLPKELSLYAKIPADRLLKIAPFLETKALKAIEFYTFVRPGADPRAHWIGTLGFKHALDDQVPA